MHVIDLELINNNYKIHIGTSYFSTIPKMILSTFTYRKVVIITDDNVSELYLNVLLKGFSSENVNCSSYIVQAGEQSKSMTQLEAIYTFLIEEEINRKDLIITLGGGVIGDLGGFAAATYLRGVDFIQVPTTLLSQVDSSVGGKVAVNLPQGKNLIGSFYHPKAVYIDTDVLKTLPEREIKSGMAEVIKYAFIRDEKLFELLTQYDIKTISQVYLEVIKICIRIKGEVVKKDEKENYERMILNFGHTIGHGIEKYYDFKKYTHGEAVGHGMYAIIKGLYLKELIEVNTYRKSMELLDQYNLILDEKFKREILFEHIKKDKKSTKNHINVILLKNICEGYIKEVDYNWLYQLVEAIC